MTRNTAIALAALGLIVAACSTTKTAGTFGPAEPTTVEALDAAVASAARAILNTPGVEITTTWFDVDGQHVRTDWLDWRSNGSFLMFSQFGGPGDNGIDQMASVRLDGDRFCASAGPNMYCDIEHPGINEAWALRAPAPAEAGATRMPISLNLEAMAGVGSSVDGDMPTDASSATKQGRADGTTMWSIDTPFDEGLINRIWTVDPNGFLDSYSAGSEGGLPFGLYSRTDFRFVVNDSPTPITAPALDTPLDLDTLGLPADVPLFSQ